MKPYLLIAALIFFVGCKNIPQGYEEVKPILELKGRAIAMLPFSVPEGSGAEVIDGIKLAELAAIQLAVQVQDSNIIGPSRMRKSIEAGIEEARFPEIMRETGAKILVTGEIQSLTTVHDKMVQSREGRINIRCRVIDTSSRTRPEYNITWGINFPPLNNQKYDPVFLTMDDGQFKDEMLKYAAKWISGLFYYHFREKPPESQIEVKWGFEQPAPKGRK